MLDLDRYALKKSLELVLLPTERDALSRSRVIEDVALVAKRMRLKPPCTPRGVMLDIGEPCSWDSEFVRLVAVARAMTEGEKLCFQCVLKTIAATAPEPGCAPLSLDESVVRVIQERLNQSAPTKTHGGVV